MGDVVNLNRLRKEKARAAAKTRASANRAAHGRTQAEKALVKARADKEKRELDGAQRERPDKG